MELRLYNPAAAAIDTSVLWDYQRGGVPLLSGTSDWLSGSATGKTGDGKELRRGGWVGDVEAMIEFGGGGDFNLQEKMPEVQNL